MSEPTIKHFGKIVNGVKHYYNPKLYEENLRELEGKEFEETLREKFKKVSTDAHGYYRGGVLGTAMNCEIFRGWEKDDVHDFFAKMYLSYTKTHVLRFPDGANQIITVKKVESTANIGSKRMKEYTDKVIQWLAEHGIEVKDPEHYCLGKYKTEIKDTKQ